MASPLQTVTKYLIKKNLIKTFKKHPTMSIAAGATALSGLAGIGKAIHSSFSDDISDAEALDLLRQLLKEHKTNNRMYGGFKVGNIKRADNVVGPVTVILYLR